MLNSDFLEVILKAILISVAFISATQAQLDPGVNQQDGALLCRVYQIASRTIGKSERSAKVQEYVDKIDLINMSLADEGWVQVITQEIEAESGAKPTGAADAAKPELRKRWRQAIETMKKNAADKSEQITLNLSARTRASKKLRLIEKKVDTLLSSIDKFVQDEQSQVETINGLFNKAIYGDDGDTKGDPNTGWDGKGGARATQCGVNNLGSPGALAGTSIGIDFHCLCVPQTSDDLQYACGVDLENGSSNKWASSNVVDTGGAMWGKLKTYCGTYPRPNSTANARRTLQEFLARLAGGGLVKANSGKKTMPGLLGAVDANSNNPGCNGQKGTTAGHGICVYYGKQDWDKNIAWFQKITTALGILETIEGAQMKLTADTAELKYLKTRAEEIYEEAKADSESEQGTPPRTTQSQNEKQDPSSPTGKATSQDPTAVSTASIQRFILPWTLLI